MLFYLYPHLCIADGMICNKGALNVKYAPNHLFLNGVELCSVFFDFLRYMNVNILTFVLFIGIFWCYVSQTAMW